MDAKYDLHGVVNHYGTLGFGHYVSFTRNPFDRKWYKYDDMNREEVPEEKIQKESAYLLFYVRRDLEGKALPQVLPDIEKSLFPGRPFKTKAGEDGFVVEELADKKGSELCVKIKSSKTRQTIR